MKLISDSFHDGAPIPGNFTFAVAAPENRYVLSSNHNPHLAWTDVPEKTRSFVLIATSWLSCSVPQVEQPLPRVCQ